MDEEMLYGMVRESLHGSNLEEMFCHHQELLGMCRAASLALTYTLANKFLTKKLKKSTIDKQEISKVMKLAALWGMQTSFKQSALSGGYLSPTQLTNKNLIDQAAQKALDSMTGKMEIDRAAEAVLDRFTRQMLPSYKETGLKMTKNKYLKLMEANVRWGYEFGREMGRI